MKKKDIATAIKVSSSTISRELKRNIGRRGGYNWETAQKNAFYHKHRCLVKVKTLGHASTDEQSAIAATHDSKVVF